MTVSTLTYSVGYVGDGVVTEFPFTFKALDDNDVKVYIDGVETTAFTIVVDPNAGGTVTMNTAPANGADVYIMRDTQVIQPMDYTPYDAFPAQSHENSLDKLTLITQELKGTALRVGAGTGAGYDAGGLPIKNVGEPVDDNDAVTKIWAETEFSGAAEAAQLAVLSLSTFQGTYIVSETEPTVDGNGDPLDAGDIWYDSVNDALFTYNGGTDSWDPWPDGSGGGSYPLDATFNSIQFTGGTGTQGTLSWNADEETLDLICDGAVLQIGQEVFINVRNNTGSTILNGQTVRYAGTIGASGRPTVALMDASILGSDELYLGIATVDIPNGEDGKICTFGKVRGIDTSAYPEGAVLYTDPSTPGGLTPFKPDTGSKIPAAFVLSSAVNGTLLVQKPKITALGDAADIDYSELLGIGYRLAHQGAGIWKPVPATRETVYSLGTLISPVNGTIQTKTLTANTTFTENLSDGDSVTLMIDDGTGFTVTWPTITWVGGTEPTLDTSGYNIIVLWKVASVLYGCYVGAA